MFTNRDARIHHIGLLIVFFIWVCQTANARTYKVKDSTEQASEEEPIPFSAEFPFFAEEHPKESEENFGFSKEFNPDFIPYSESRSNVTRYVNPAETYHAVKDMPGRGRDHSSRSYKGDDGYRKEDPSYRKDYRKDSYRPKDDSYDRDEPYRRQDPYKKGGDTYRKGESYRKGDAYRKDGGYRKSDSYRKEESFKKEEPRHRSGGNRDYHKEQSGHRKHESYRRDNDRPSYRKEESSYHKQEPSYRKDDGYGREHREDGYRKKPIQNLYDDWSPEEDKSISGEREERTDESELEEDEEGDYPEHDDDPPHSYKDTDSRKSVPTSMKPGPPYYTPNFKRPGESKSHSSSNQGRHDHAATPTPQTFYTPSTKAHEQSKQFQHRKGQPVAAKSSQFDKEWSEFRPSPPDPIQPSRARSREEYPETDYSNPATKKAAVATTPMPINRQNCVKLKKMENPPNANGKYVKNMMTCYVCVDEKSGSNYEQCSYESDSKTKPYLHTAGEEEASHSSISHRQKRDISPTDRTKREKDYYENKKDKPSYKFNSDSFDEKDDVSDSSDKDEDEGSAADYDSDDNCYRKKKGDMSCIVCESANKQGSYEQCSYQSDPKKNKYEHSVEKVYGSPRLPESDSKYNKKESRYTSSDEYDASPEIPSKTDYSSSEFEAPPPSQDKSKSKNILQGGSFGFGLDSFDFSDIGGEFGKSGKSKSSFDFGDSFDFDSIPEPADNEGRFSSRHDTFNFKSDEMADIDMSKDIGGFDKKNRSDCKKVIKNKMTCYQCAGGKGAKEEECMYVAAAEPKKKHLSFSQVQEYKFDPQNTSELDMDYSPFSFGKRKYKKYHPDLTDIKFFNKLKEKATMEASRWPRSVDSNSTSSKQKKKAVKGDLEGAASNRNYKHEEDDEEEDEDDASEEDDSEEDSDISDNDEYNAVPTDPPEIDYKEAEKGEFHKDTESAWDPKLGISLPRYMLHKSEHEAVFDEVLASG